MGLDQRLSIVHEDKEVWAKTFRKVNFLHRWIEEHCNEGRETNCDDIPLNLEQVAGLSLTCSKVLEEPYLADELLPTEGRFFFGDTSYDQYYLEDVRDVREACLAILEAGQQHHSHGGTPFTITYWSWW